MAPRRSVPRWRVASARGVWCQKQAGLGARTGGAARRRGPPGCAPVLRTRRNEVIALPQSVLQEFARHFGAHGVGAIVHGPRVATTVPAGPLAACGKQEAATCGGSAGGVPGAQRPPRAHWQGGREEFQS